MAHLRDRVWIWGHPEGRYNHEFGNEQESRMTPLEGALYMGARNLFMVPVGVNVNVRQYNKSFTPLKSVGWAIDNAAADPAALNQLIEQAKDFPNISCGVFDDFVGYLAKHPIPPERFLAVRERMHTEAVRPLSMWMVLYTHEFGVDAAQDEADAAMAMATATATICAPQMPSRLWLISASMRHSSRALSGSPAQ